MCLTPSILKYTSNHTRMHVPKKNQNQSILPPKKTTSDTSVISPKIPKLTTQLSLGAVRRQSTATTSVDSQKYQQLFSKTTKAIVWGMQTRAVQSMLDFDFICR